MEIITNNQERNFLYEHEVPKHILENDLDYAKDTGDGFIKYKGNYYHLCDFMRIEGNFPNEFKGWNGYLSDSFFSGILIKVSEDGETYKIATYIP